VGKKYDWYFKEAILNPQLALYEIQRGTLKA
jgi:hypothetical protein